MLNDYLCRGYLLLQCAIALLCVSIGLSLLIKLHVKSLHTQRILQADAWVLIHAGSARHIQHFYSLESQQEWQEKIENTLPKPVAQIAWHPQGSMKICWEGSECWQLE